jgi:tetratricopeptide (TPR) repeat protein
MPSGERNIAIMEKDYYDRGMDDQRTLFYLANGYRESGRHEDAIEFYRKYLTKSKWGEERFFARYFMAQALVVLERYGEARREAIQAIAEDFRFAEAYILLGDLAFKEGDIKRAQLWFMMASETPYPKDAKLFVTPILYDEYPMARIKDCHEKLVGQNSFEENLKKLHEPKSSAPSEPKVTGSFALSDDLEEALTAASVLSVIAQKKGNIFEITVKDELKAMIDSMSGIVESTKDDAVSLILPSNMNGRPREEWYGRAAGYVFSDWEPIVQQARVEAAKARRAMNAN